MVFTGKYDKPIPAISIRERFITNFISGFRVNNIGSSFDLSIANNLNNLNSNPDVDYAITFSSSKLQIDYVQFSYMIVDKPYPLTGNHLSYDPTNSYSGLFQLFYTDKFSWSGTPLSPYSFRQLFATFQPVYQHCYGGSTCKD